MENDTSGEMQGYFYIWLVACNHLSSSKKAWRPVQGQAWAAGEETCLSQRCLWRTWPSKHAATYFTGVAAEVGCGCTQMDQDTKMNTFKKKKKVWEHLALALRTVAQESRQCAAAGKASPAV